MEERRFYARQQSKRIIQQLEEFRSRSVSIQCNNKENNQYFTSRKPSANDQTRLTGFNKTSKTEKDYEIFKHEEYF